jgi:hypothetical protein
MMMISISSNTSDKDLRVFSLMTCSDLQVRRTDPSISLGVDRSLFFR